MIVCLHSHSARPTPTHHDPHAGRGHQKLANGRSVRQCRCKSNYAIRSFPHEQTSHVCDIGRAEAKTASQNAHQSSTAGRFRTSIELSLFHFVCNNGNEHIRPEAIHSGQLHSPGRNHHSPTRSKGFRSRPYKALPQQEAQ
jgi:hypothetical protein